MALKVIMMRHSIDKKKSELEQLRALDAEFITREAELEAAINEAETEEQEQAVTEMVEQFDAEKQAHEDSKAALAGEIEKLESDLSEIEKESPEPGTPPAQQEERKGEIIMDTRKKFFGMDMQQRDAFFAQSDVKDFLSQSRLCRIINREIQAFDNFRHKHRRFQHVNLVVDIGIVPEQAHFSKFVRLRRNAPAPRVLLYYQGARPRVNRLGRFDIQHRYRQCDNYAPGNPVPVGKAHREDIPQRKHFLAVIFHVIVYFLCHYYLGFNLIFRSAELSPAKHNHSVFLSP